MTAFQCSSASRKFLNRQRQRVPAAKTVGFSALQRAENSSIVYTTRNDFYVVYVSVLFSEPKIPQFAQWIADYGRDEEFQCSSASRKFLNVFFSDFAVRVKPVSVLFSEPKIPQSPDARLSYFSVQVSVLFSEPKIPQLVIGSRFVILQKRFSALQRAENSSIFPMRLTK